MSSATGELGGPERGAGWVGWASQDSLSGQVAPAAGLEADDDVRDLQVPFLLQVSQHAGPEEDLALADAVQVAVELQGFDLDGGELATYPLPPLRSPGARPRTGEGPGAWVRPALWAAFSWCRESTAGGTLGSRQVGAGMEQVTSQTCREAQNLGPEGTLDVSSSSSVPPRTLQSRSTNAQSSLPPSRGGQASLFGPSPAETPAQARIKY